MLVIFDARGRLAKEKVRFEDRVTKKGRRTHDARRHTG